MSLQWIEQLPPDVLQKVFVDYLPCRDVCRFVEAIASSHQHAPLAMTQSSWWSLWNAALDIRSNRSSFDSMTSSSTSSYELTNPRRHHHRIEETLLKSHDVPMLQEEEVHKKDDPSTLCHREKMSNDGAERSRTTMQKVIRLSKRLMVLDYQERLFGVVWSGCMEFKNSSLSLPDHEARVVLRVPSSSSSSPSLGCCKLPYLNGWTRTVSETTIQVISRPYRFFPVSPRAFLLGMGEEDRIVLRQIQTSLAQRDQVLTLRFPNPNGLIVRIISPTQAKERLQRFSSRSATALVQELQEGVPDHERDSCLVCCWEYNHEEDDSDHGKEGNTLQEAALFSIRHILQRHRRMVGCHSSS